MSAALSCSKHSQYTDLKSGCETPLTGLVTRRVTVGTDGVHYSKVVKSRVDGQTLIIKAQRVHDFISRSPPSISAETATSSSKALAQLLELQTRPQASRLANTHLALERSPSLTIFTPYLLYMGA